MRDGYISDLVSKWGVCFGVREYIKVVISTSQLLHINYFMTFPFVTSYFGSVTLEIIIKSRGLTIGEVVILL